MIWEVYLKIDGIKGDCSDAGHEGDIKVISYSVGSKKGMEVVKKTAGDWIVYDGKSLGDVNLVKLRDHTTPRFFQWCASGEHIDSATLTAEIFSDKNALQKSITLLFKDVVFTSLQFTYQGVKIPVEEISFAFSEVKLKEAKAK
jgi:type VI secretion system secreted protein Hcp